MLHKSFEYSQIKQEFKFIRGGLFGLVLHVSHYFAISAHLARKKIQESENIKVQFDELELSIQKKRFIEYCFAYDLNEPIYIDGADNSISLEESLENYDELKKECDSFLATEVTSTLGECLDHRYENYDDYFTDTIVTGCYRLWSNTNYPKHSVSYLINEVTDLLTKAVKANELEILCNKKKYIIEGLQYLNEVFSTTLFYLSNSDFHGLINPKFNITPQLPVAKPQKSNPNVPNHFTLVVGLKDGSEGWDDINKILKKQHYVNRNTKTLSIINLFNTNQSFVDWTGSMASLKCFLNFLISENIIKKKPSKWKIASKLFSKNGNPITHTQLYNVNKVEETTAYKKVALENIKSYFIKQTLP